MTKREIASLAIKLMGVFILIKAIAYVPMAFSGLFSAWRTVEGPGLFTMVMPALMALFFAVIPLAWSLFIIVLSDKVATWLIEETENTCLEVGALVNKEDVMIVVCSCIGLYLAVAA